MPPLPRQPHQQDVVMCRCRSSANRYAWRLWQATGFGRSCPNWSTSVVRSHEAPAHPRRTGGSPSCQVQVPRPPEDFHLAQVGFTKFDKDEFQEKLGSGHIITDGVGCQYKPDHGPLAAWKKRMAA